MQNPTYPGMADYLAGYALAVLFCGVLLALLWRTVGVHLRRRRLAVQRRRALSAELDALVTRVRAALTLNDTLDLRGAEASRPRSIEVANRMIAEHIPAENLPADHVFDRYRCLPRQQVLLGMLTAFRHADEQFAEAARQLDRRVTGLIGDHNAPLRIDPIHDPLERSCFFGLVHGLPESELDRRLGVPADVMARARARARALESDAEIAALVPPYLTARVRLSAAAAALWA